MKIVSLALALGLLSPCVVEAVEISNFKTGLVCASNRVCHETEKIKITGQGSCVYGGEQRPCTWFGFEFDYKNHSQSNPIECNLEFSHPVSIGNPHEIVGKKLTEKQFELEIPEGDGHFFNPQYRIYAEMKEEERHQIESTKCTSGNKALFEYTREYVYPRLP